MELIADILLVAGALGAGLYCFVLSRRLKRFTDLEKGVGGAVAVLSTQADELKKSLDSARDASDQSGAVLKDLTEQAETVAQRLELMMASMHDVVPQEDAAQKTTEPKPEAEAESELSDGSQQMPTAFEEPGEPEAEETSTTTQAKRPGGLMFFRHDRSRGEVAT
ncbi:hypothetical protein [Ruegeria lacuscaerulensis]|uniref:hypothetical protein n=1 Tax=Ruegeria lacuscaerulensis TaxID=55218 RepID=UPI001479927E|nr:hypothetical protein [Ruegeria lacuscaerulensis]